METKYYISYNELMKYKDHNMDIHPDLKQFATSLSRKSNSTSSRHKNKTSWKKPEKKIKNTWVIDSKKPKTDEEKLYSQIRSILNKLSDSNFNDLASEFIQLEIKNKENLMTLVDIIFKKAVLETKFNEIYAKLCYELASYYIEDNETKVYFRELLLNKCQQTFEESIGITISENDGIRTKEYVIGCMKFVGQLYNINLLTNKVIYSCFLILLSKIPLGNNLAIDCVCNLMETVGTKFSGSAQKESTNIYDKLEKLKDSDKLDKKDMFALMDILDMRKK